ncbi:MAG TPA: hypothetical protein VFW66_12510 [Gemmatimonadales bacterium]|nr:hypothetical protein [Gemmatimonadales bacterium]
MGLAPSPLAAQQPPATKDAMAKDGMAKDAMGHDAIAPHGSFSGVGGHKAGGSYTVTTEGGTTRLALSDDFPTSRASPSCCSGARSTRWRWARPSWRRTTA